VQYHEIYGFSLNIRDIDAQYTLGERAKKRQEIIARLQEDGVFNMNAELELPIVPQRLAVISSETAAGFGDFMDQLNSNEFGYSFEVKLFNSVMQGDQAEPSIIASLHQIFESIEAFDLVVLIRGGGASLDLDCFDSYELASHIAQFPLPVITGIGHERDETIADLVAHSKMKTPTAVAEFVISGCRNFEMSINEKFDTISGRLNARLELERSIIDHHVFGFQRAVQQKIYDQNNRLQSLAYALNIASEKAIQNQELKLHSMEHVVMLDVQQYLSGQSKLLDHYAKELTLLDPENVLKRGYSITLVEGKNINNISRLVKGAKIKTITRKLEIDSKYEQSKKRQ
jgi:exodeoxyribonuclease VII large subunit